MKGRRSLSLLAGLVVAHLLAVSGQVDTGGGTSLLERGVLTLVSPFQNAIAGTFYGVRSFWTGYVDLRGVRRDNEALRARVALLETQLAEHREAALEAGRLRALLALRERLPVPAVAARVVARDGSPWFRTLSVDKGSADGVALDAPAVDIHGVLGRVVAVGPSTARIQLLLHRDAAVAVRDQRSRVSGVASGQVGLSEAAGLDLVLRYVPLRADVSEGDAVVTSGLDRIYPPGLVVGSVRSAEPGSGLFQEVRVTPSARFREVEQVLLLEPLGPLAEATETVE